MPDIRRVVDVGAHFEESAETVVGVLDYGDQIVFTTGVHAFRQGELAQPPRTLLLRGVDEQPAEQRGLAGGACGRGALHDTADGHDGVGQQIGEFAGEAVDQVARLRPGPPASEWARDS